MAGCRPERSPARTRRAAWHPAGCALLLAALLGPAAADRGAAGAGAALTPAAAQALWRDGAIDQPLAATPGDAARGRAIVADRQRGMCLLCHSGPFAAHEERFQGNIAGDLRGAGRRWTAGQLRARLVDARRLNADSPMPPYYRDPARLERVAPAHAGRTLLDAQQIEDVVAFLLTLRDE
jgi:sulfur-oxidizing protein SoxX